MELVEYRNTNGYPLGKTETLKNGHERSFTKATLILCPEHRYLLHIEECKKCDLFRGMKRAGVECKSTKPRTVPECYKL